MNLKNKTILVTGGSSGIGLELTHQLVEANNKVIICARSIDKLIEVKKELPSIEIYQCDLADTAQCEQMTGWLNENFPDLSVLINNAAIVHRDPFATDDQILQKAEKETAVNFLAPVRLCKLLLPVISKNDHPIIINVTTGLIYSPKAQYTFYNATKAALHSFTQVLRMQLKETPVKVIEAMFPVVDTPWHEGNPPKIAISPEKAVRTMLRGVKSGKSEIKIGAVKLLSFIHRISPGFAIRKINSI